MTLPGRQPTPAEDHAHHPDCSWPTGLHTECLDREGFSLPGRKPSRSATPFSLWQEARTMADTYDEQDDIWHRLMTQHGLNKDAVAAYLTVHCILAKHSPADTCEICPCRHCASQQSDPDGDHSCPCPYSDNDCPHHPWARRGVDA